jgi:hypothetical protein
MCRYYKKVRCLKPRRVPGSIGKDYIESYLSWNNLTVRDVKIGAARVVVPTILLLVSTGSLSFSASAHSYELIPGRDGLDLSRGNKRVLVTAPKGWEAPKGWPVGPVWFQPRNIDYAIGFRLVGQDSDLVLSVWSNHRGRSNTDKVTPRNSYVAANLETNITELKQIESFDAGLNGRQKIWQIRTGINDYLLVLIVQPDKQGRTEVDIYLSGVEADQLRPYLGSLKEVAKSIRIVDR